MNDEDVALFHRAEALATSGQQFAAHQLFCQLRDHGNTKVEIFFWIASTSADAMAAIQAIETIRSLQPHHPKLPELEAFYQRKIHMPSTHSSSPPYTQPSPQHSQLGLPPMTSNNPPHTQFTSPPAPRRNSLISLAVFIGLALMLIGGYFLLAPLFAPKPPDGFMNTEDTVTIHVLRYLHWTEVNGQISGYWSIAEVKGNMKPLYGNGDLTGMHSGNEISLTFYPTFDATSNTDTGTLNGNTLTLQAPMPDGTLGILIYQGVSQEQYNQALSGFKMAYGG